MNRKTILHLIETGGPGGAENVMISLASGLNKDRFQSIACLRKDGWLFDKLSDHGVETHIIKEKKLFDLNFILSLRKLIVRKKIILIHAHEFLMNFYSTIVGILTGLPTVTTVHGKNYYWMRKRRVMAMQFISRFSQMVSVSNELRYFINEKIGIDPDNITTIYNGINTRLYSPEETGFLKKAEFGIEKTTKIVGMVANLYPVKGHTYLLKAIPAILREYPHVVFLFIGRGHLEETLRREALHLGISNHVRFLGFRSDVYELLDIMDIFVLSSLEECLPLSVLEAMSKGLSCVVTDVGGNQEIIENGKTGFIVPPKDPESLAEKITFLLKNKETAECIGVGASAIVRSKFSHETMLSQYEALYNSLIYQ